MSDSQGEQLLQAIRENPGDVSLVLIYADWLEENGRELAANAIRIRKRVGRLIHQGNVPGHGVWSDEGMGLGVRWKGSFTSGTSWWTASPFIDHGDSRVEFLETLDAIQSGEFPELQVQKLSTGYGDGIQGMSAGIIEGHGSAWVSGYVDWENSGRGCGGAI